MPSSAEIAHIPDVDDHIHDNHHDEDTEMDTESTSNREPATSAASSPDEPTLDVTLTHHGKKHTFALPVSATITDLSSAIETTLSVPPSHQKLLIAPKPGLLRPPFPDPALPLAPLASRKITLMGSTPAEVSKLQSTIMHATATQAARSQRAYPIAPATPARTVGRGVAGSARASEEARYTFHTLRPLGHLPRPERSLAFLERLRDDAGIRAVMRAHKFAVPLLTEMDPAAHTTHEARTLGLNRNGGEVIELRLRTDAYDGYRDYKTIRRTLCHELAHNVWGEHDRNFWNLCRMIEGEVERADWRAGGRRVGGVGGDEVYEPADDPETRGDVFDHGAWTGGEFVLGGGSGAEAAPAPVVGSSGTVVQAGSLSRREILARAAEERARRAKQQQQQQQQQAEGSGSGGADAGGDKS